MKNQTTSSFYTADVSQEDRLIEVTITVISVDGVVAKKFQPKSKIQAKRRKNCSSVDAVAVTSIVASLCQDISSEKAFFTHVPSLPLQLDAFSLSSDQSHPVVQWPNTDAEDDTCVHKLSTVRMKRRFQREAAVDNKAPCKHRLKPQTCPIIISISRHGKLINLGKASVIVNGEENGMSSISIPISSTYRKPKVKVGRKSNEGTPMMRIKGDCVQFGLNSDAMLRVFVSVADVGAERINKEILATSLIQTEEEFASDPSGKYTDDDDFDAAACEYVLDEESVEHDDYEVGDCILVENTDESEELRSLRKELSESKDIIENLTKALSSALEMSKQVKESQILNQTPAATKHRSEFSHVNNKRGHKGKYIRPPPPPPPPRASEVLDKLSIISDSSPPSCRRDSKCDCEPEETKDDLREVYEKEEDCIGSQDDRSLSTVHEEDEEHDFEEVSLAGNNGSVVCDSLDEQDEEHDYEEVTMTDKYGFVVCDEEKRKDHFNLFVVDKLKEADEQRWESILKMVSPRMTTNSYCDIQAKVKYHTRKGLPDSMRQRAWIVLTGVDIIMSQRKGVYSSLLNQANSISSSQASGLTPNGKHSMRTALQQIDRDTERTSLKHFSSHRDGQGALRRVLRAYSQLDTDVGYCQGMNYIAAMLLTFLSEEESFWLLGVVMNEEPYNLRELFGESMSGTHEVLYIADKLVKQFFPKLSKHMQKEGVRNSMFVTQWLLTLYTSSFPLDLVSRVWDSFLVEGWKVIYRVMLSLLKHAEGTLLELSFEHILHYLSTIPAKVDGQTILKGALKIGLKTKHIQKHADDWRRRTMGSGASSSRKVKQCDSVSSATISTCSVSTT